jgi:aminoglycoside phosphotransferase (APT) family kinase protein
MSELRSQLQEYYQQRAEHGERVAIGDLTSLSIGWESEIYAFTLECGPAGQRVSADLVLRIYPGDDGYDKSEREFSAMIKLRQAGYPVPGVYLLERDHSPFGRPFIIMEKVSGQMMWPLLSAAKDPGRQAQLLSLFCRLFVDLHKLDWRPFVDDVSRFESADPYRVVEMELERWRPFFSSYPLPGFPPLMEWLDARRKIPCRRPSPIHWDFHPGNIMIRPDGSPLVIDWTGFDVSDARFDLAWTLLLVRAYESIEWSDQLLAEYERLSGAPVEHFDFFEVAACARRLFSIVLSVRYGAEKLGMRPGAEQQMKQAEPIRRVYRLLQERSGLRISSVEELLDSLQK